MDECLCVCVEYRGVKVIPIVLSTASCVSTAGHDRAYSEREGAGIKVNEKWDKVNGRRVVGGVRGVVCAPLPSPGPPLVTPTCRTLERGARPPNR